MDNVFGMLFQVPGLLVAFGGYTYLEGRPEYKRYMRLPIYVGGCLALAGMFLALSIAEAYDLGRHC